VARFEFRFDPVYRRLSAPFGITPQTTMVEVVDGRFTARFGPWVLETTLDNIECVKRTGPYALSKTAGPVRLSLVDRGLTMATNGEAGLCVLFKKPVGCIDPLGALAHPGLTLTVDRIEDLATAITGKATGQQLEKLSAEVVGESPWSILGRWAKWPAGVALATARYVASTPEVQRTGETRSGPPPRLAAPEDAAEVQPIEEGEGSAYQRLYRVLFAGSLTPEQVIDRVLSDLNAVSPTEVAEFVPQHVEDSSGEVGREFVVRMPGPWSANVRIIGRTPTSFTLATLRGHMEAGQIEFRSGIDDDDDEGHRFFEICSVARSGNRPFGFLYDRARIASEMQMHMWAHFCRRVVTLCEGRQLGKVSVHTIRYEG